MQKTRVIYPLNSPAEIRTALRKRTVQTAIYKEQSIVGSRQVDELFAYINFMTEEECQAFLNSVKEAPFIPNINMMWTQQIIEYLMLSDVRCIQHCATVFVSGASEMINKSFRDDVTYPTKVVRRHVDKAFWHLLPDGWAAKYYTPSQVLKIAVDCGSVSDVCKHIAERLFIKAADLEDCLSPVTKMPPALPKLPKVRGANGKTQLVLKDFPEGTHVAIDIPKPEEPMTPKISEIPKVSEVPKRRRNPVAAAAPMFATEGCYRPTPDRSKEINSYIETHYSGFGGTDSAHKIADYFGTTTRAICQRVHRIKVQKDRETGANKYADVHYSSGNITRRIDPEIREKIFDAIKTRLRSFGGNESPITLAREFGVSDGTINRYARMIRANAGASAN